MTCPRCNDTKLMPTTDVRIVDDKVEVSNISTDCTECDPKVLAMRTLDEFDRQRRKQSEFDAMVTAAGLLPRYRHGWSGLDPKIQPQALIASKTWAENVLSKAKTNSWLFLTGNVGTGKTHLLSGAIYWCVIGGLSNVRIVSAPAMIDRLRLAMDAHDPIDGYVEKIRRAKALALDDLGAHTMTDWTTEIIYNLVDYRYSHLLPTAVASNYTLDELASKPGWARIVSRIAQDAVQVKMQNGDVRLQGVKR